MTVVTQDYNSTDQGAPSCTGEEGSMIALLDAVLVDGYSPAAVAGITLDGTTATAELASSNATLVSGNWLAFGGADQSEYNGIVQVTVVDDTHVTFEITGSPATPATGTITYNKASLGWTKLFTSTDKAVYQSADNSSNQFCLFVDDSGGTAGGTNECLVYGAESFSDIDTPISRFPDTTLAPDGLVWFKSFSADSTPYPWSIFGNSKTLYLHTNAVVPLVVGFGHCVPFYAGEGYNTFVAGYSPNSPTGDGGLGGAVPGIDTQPWRTDGNLNVYMARDAAQASNIALNIVDSGAVYASTTGLGGNYGPSGGASGESFTAPLDYPGAPDTSLYVLPRLLFDATGVGSTPPRARLPGCYAPWHNAPLDDGELATGFAVGLPADATLVAKQSYTPYGYGSLLFDRFGPWE